MAFHTSHLQLWAGALAIAGVIYVGGQVLKCPERNDSELTANLILRSHVWWSTDSSSTRFLNIPGPSWQSSRTPTCSIMPGRVIVI